MSYYQVNHSDRHMRAIAGDYGGLFAIDGDTDEPKVAAGVPSLVSPDRPSPWMLYIGATFVDYRRGCDYGTTVVCVCMSHAHVSWSLRPLQGLRERPLRKYGPA